MTRYSNRAFEGACTAPVPWSSVQRVKSVEQVVNGDRDRQGGRHRRVNVIAAIDFGDNRVFAFSRLAVLNHALTPNIDEPQFRDARLGVDGHLDTTVEADR